MTLGGWITFLLSTISFSALFAWCLYKVLSTKSLDEDRLHGTFDISEFEKEDDNNQNKK